MGRQTARIEMTKRDLEEAVIGWARDNIEHSINERDPVDILWPVGVAPAPPIVEFETSPAAPVAPVFAEVLSPNIAHPVPVEIQHAV